MKELFDVDLNSKGSSPYPEGAVKLRCQLQYFVLI